MSSFLCISSNLHVQGAEHKHYSTRWPPAVPLPSSVPVFLNHLPLEALAAGRAPDAQRAWAALRGSTRSIVTETHERRQRFQRLLKMSPSLPWYGSATYLI